MSANILVDRMLKVFCEVQENKSAISDSLKWLQDYYEEIGYEQFKEEFLHVLLLLQMHADFKAINLFYENIFEFWTKSLRRFDATKKNEFKQFLLEGFIKNSDHTTDILRFRVCEGILALFTIEANFVEVLPDMVVENLRDSMLDRIKDRTLLIKILAVEIMQFLQDIEDVDDPIVAALVENLVSNNVKVRVAAIKAIAPLTITIPPLIERIKDVNEKVRLVACKKFASIPAQKLTIVQRHTLIRNSLKDFADSVHDCAEQILLPWWLKCYNASYMELMKALLLDGTDQEIKQTKELTESVLVVLFGTQSVANMLSQIKLNEKLILEDDLSWSKAMYWRCLIQHFINEPEGQQFLDQILPATPDLCEYMLRYYNTNKEKSMSKWEYGNYQRTLEELVRLVVLCDVSDECSRIVHKRTILQLLRGDVSTDIIATIFTYIKKTYPDPNTRINFVCEFVNDIRNTSESSVGGQDFFNNEEKMNRIRKDIHKLQEDQRLAIKELNLQQADTLKQEIDGLKGELAELLIENNKEEHPERNNDPGVILKCTNIIIELLQAPDIMKLNSYLQTMQEELLKDLVTVTDPAIQSRIMQCYAILCSFSKESAVACVKLFTPMLISYRDRSAEVAECLLVSVVSSLTDVMLVWGEKAFPTLTQDQDTSLEEMFTTICYKETIQIFVSMMDDKSDMVRETSGVAVMKLLDLNRIQSSLLLSRLILKWFNPITAEKDLMLHQYLGVFLVNFNLEAHAGRQYVEAFIPTVVAVARAQGTSPLAAISIDKLVKFMIHVTSPEVTRNAELHRNLARLLTRAIRNDIHNVKCNVIYCKVMLMLDIYHASQEFLQVMIDAFEDLINECQEADNPITLRRYIQKILYQLNVSSCQRSGNEAMSEEEEVNNRSA